MMKNKAAGSVRIFTEMIKVLEEYRIRKLTDVIKSYDDKKFPDFNVC